MCFVSSCNNLRDKPLLETVRVPPPPPADKNWQSSREISVNGREKNSQRALTTDIEIYCWFSLSAKLSNCHSSRRGLSPQVPWPQSLCQFRRHDQRPVCGSLLLTEQLESKSILPDPECMAGSGLWRCLVWPTVCFKQKKNTGTSSGECCFSWV